MKTILIGRFGSEEKRNAELDLVAALGGRAFEGQDGTRYAILPDDAPVAQAAVKMPIQAPAPGWKDITPV